MFSLEPAFTSSLVYSTYKSSTQQNATLTGQDRQGDVQLIEFLNVAAGKVSDSIRNRRNSTGK